MNFIFFLKNAAAPSSSPARQPLSGAVVTGPTGRRRRVGDTKHLRFRKQTQI